MVTTIGILGTGFFGAGMRAVQEREENILRRYKVTPITPVPLLLASIAMGVILYLPTVASDVVPGAQPLSAMPIPANLLSLFLFVCLGAAAFRSLGLIIAAVVNSSQEAQHPHPDRLHADAVSERRDLSALVHAGLAADRHPIHSGQLSGDRHVRNSSARRNDRAKFEIGRCALWSPCWSHFLSRPNFSAGKRKKSCGPRPNFGSWSFLLPFFFLGGYQAWSRQELTKAKILERDLRRGHNWLIQNARIFVGNGKVIESGSVLIKQGKIDRDL